MNRITLKLLALTLLYTAISGTLITACLPQNPLYKGASITVMSAGATYNLNEYCENFTQEERIEIRKQVNLMSIHQAKITCVGDE